MSAALLFSFVTPVVCTMLLLPYSVYTCGLARRLEANPRRGHLPGSALARNHAHPEQQVKLNAIHQAKIQCHRIIIAVCMCDAC